MKNIFESIAVILVLLLSIGIVYLIVQYNMIKDDTYDDVVSTIPAATKISKEKKSSNYLENMESYSDQDVKVDPTKEDTTNRIVVHSENKDNLDIAVEEKKKEEIIENESEPILPKEEIVDKIGMEIDEVLNGG